MASLYDDDDDWGEGDALQAEGNEIVSGAYRAGSASSSAFAAENQEDKDDSSSPTQSRAQRLQAKIEREAALRSGRGAGLASYMHSATAGRGAARSGSGRNIIAGNEPSSNNASSSQRIISPDERLAAKIAAAEDNSARSLSGAAPTSVASPQQQHSPEAPEDRLAAKIRRETASSTNTASAGESVAKRNTTTAHSHESNGSASEGTSNTSDRIQARLRQQQRRAQASYSAGSGRSLASASSASMPMSSAPGVTIHGPTRTGSSGGSGGGGSIAERASAKGAAAGGAASTSNPDDRLRSKVVQQQSSAAATGLGLGSISEDRAESTPDDRLQAKILRESSAAAAAGKWKVEESTPADRLQSKLLRGGESVRRSADPTIQSSVDSTPDDRLAAKIRMASATTGAGGLAGDGNGGGEARNTKGSRYAAAAAAAGAGAAAVGAVAVRGAHADEYDKGIRRSRYSESLSDSSDSSADDGFVGEDPNDEPSGEAREGDNGPAEKKKDGAGICGMSKRMAVVVGAALLVIVIAAAAGGAAAAGSGGGNNASSPGGGNGSNTSPTDPPTPLEGSAPTRLPTLAPTPFVPPECQLTMLSKGEEIGDFQESDRFGSSVAVSGDTAIVGAPLSSKGGTVHLYQRGDDYTWAKSANVLKASASIESDLFGKALAIYGNTIAVGALIPNPDSEFGDSENVGCVYVFIRQADGSWVEETRLLSDDTSSSDASFGSALAIYENIIVVGEPDGSFLPLIERTGSVYVFEKINGASWVQRAKLRPQDGNTGDNFGNSVDISESTFIVGAVRNDASGKDSGAAYVYSKVDGSWALKTKLVPIDGSAFDSFGRSVAISGDAIVVGARGDDDNGSSSGSAYVFVDNNGQWVEATKLLAEDGEASDGFGKAVDVDGDFIVIGAEGADHEQKTALENTGAAYVFERVGFSVWAQISHLQPSGGDKDDAFGSSVATSDGTMVIGSLTSVFGLIETGNAHVIEMC